MALDPGVILHPVFSFDSSGLDTRGTEIVDTTIFEHVHVLLEALSERRSTNSPFVMTGGLNGWWTELGRAIDTSDGIT